MVLAGSPPIVTLDANVLYGMPLRDTLLRAAEKRLYRPMWSYEIWNKALRHLKDPLEREHPLTAADLKKRSTSPQQVLDKLEQVGITRFARAIRAYLEEETAQGH